MDPDGSEPATGPSQAYNTYTPRLDFRQPSETVAEFLRRLPPAEAESTIPPHIRPPWYWIANPDRSAYGGRRASTDDVEALVRDGAALLRQFSQDLARCARNDPVRTQLREALKNEIGEAARRHGVTAGKWMLFPRVDEVNDVWRAVCEGVVANRLGTTAKVATSGQKPGDGVRLVCVYTRDFTDVEDVRRVVRGLVDMGLVRADMPRGIMYKCDAYTYLGIYGNNEYGLRASIYGSTEMLGGS